MRTGSSESIVINGNVQRWEISDNRVVNVNNIAIDAIGDMLDTIAHQWRQPLTHIGYLVMNISGAMRNNRFDANFWSKKESEINLQIEYMSQTLTKTYAMVKSILLVDEIAFVIEGEQNVMLFGNESELRQVLLNLIHNAKEAFEKTTIEDKKITINIQDSTLLIKDNAGGIPNPIQKGYLPSTLTTTTLHCTLCHRLSSCLIFT